MGENHYTISEASKKLDIEAHVLRYWEEELQMEIPRNEMGHRYYTDVHIQMFERIKEMKDMGYQLKAIKSVLVSEMGHVMGTEESMPAVTKEHEIVQEPKVSVLSQEDKMEQFQTIMTHIVAQALRSNSDVFGQKLGATVSDKVIKEMNYIARMQDEREEERYRRLDEALRAYQRGQKGRIEAAATRPSVVQMKKKRKKFLGKNKF